jgi:hypothetical protein
MLTSIITNLDYETVKNAEMVLVSMGALLLALQEEYIAEYFGDDRCSYIYASILAVLNNENCHICYEKAMQCLVECAKKYYSSLPNYMQSLANITF